MIWLMSVLLLSGGKVFSQVVVTKARDSNASAFIMPSQIDDATIETLAGIPEEMGYNKDGIPARESRLAAPQDVAFLDENHLLISDMNNHRIRILDLRNGIINTFAGTGTKRNAGNGKDKIEADIAYPRGLAVDEFGNVFISTQHQIRMIRTDGTIDLYAGSSLGDQGDEDPKEDAKFNQPQGLAVDPTNGNLLVADNLNHKVRMISPDGLVTTLAGTGIAGDEGDGGEPELAQLHNPIDVEVDIFGTIYIAEYLGKRIRMIRDGEIQTIYDNVLDPSFSRPRGLAMMDDIFLFITGNDHYVRRYNVFNTLVEVVAGNGDRGYAGDRTEAIDALLNAPAGSVVGPDENLYLADTENHVIRRINLPPHDIEPTPTPYTPTPTPHDATPTPTPTRTPRSRTPTPTPTFFPTATATPTPTALPEGQLAPPIRNTASPSANYTFYTNQTSIYVPDDPASGRLKIVLASTQDGRGEILTRDTIALTITHPSGSVEHVTKTFTDLSVPQPPEDVTQYFEEGINQVELRLIESKGTEFSSTPLYLVIFSSPQLKNLPDIRGLVDEDINNVYNLDNFVYDRDTPKEEITWSVEQIDPEPEVTIDPQRNVSVEAVDEPMESRVIFSADDSIFQVTEEVRIKISTYQITDFILPDAPLVEDFAYVSPYSLRRLLDPPNVNISDVPFETELSFNSGLKSALVARGEVFLFPEFPGRKVTQPELVSLWGKRSNQPEDKDGAVIQTASVVSPGTRNAERNYNFFNAKTFADTDWFVTQSSKFNEGRLRLGKIPSDIPFITDGYGAIFNVKPGEAISMSSDRIPLPPGPAKISIWFAVEKFDQNNDDMPTVWIALMEDSKNISYFNVSGEEILGNSRYQRIHTTFDVIKSNVYAIIQVVGSQRMGEAEVYVDNVRIYPAERDIDLALGATKLPADFDGTFNSNLKGLGTIVEDLTYFHATASITDETNRTVTPGTNLREQALKLTLGKDERSAVQIRIGPNEMEEDLFPRNLNARAYVQALEEIGGTFAIALITKDAQAVTYRSNDRFPNQPEWNEITVNGNFRNPSNEPPLLILENRVWPGPFPGVVEDGATLAVDDVSIQASLDSKHLWDHTLIPDSLRKK